MSELNKLKIGDKVCNISHQNCGDDVYYRFDEVERLTKTQVILKSGVKLINEPTKSWIEKEYSFMTYGDRHTRWNIVTPEIIEQAKKEKERQSINSWFRDRKFTQEERVQVYKLLNNNNDTHSKNG